MPYEYIDDVAVADVQFRAWGSDLTEVFVSAADATMNVMIHDLDTIEPREQRAFNLQNDALDMLLFDFLQELIFYKDSQQLLLRVPKVHIYESQGSFFLKADAVGEQLDPARHDQGVDVKAVTLHRFALEKNEQGWTNLTILDI